MEIAKGIIIGFAVAAIVLVTTMLIASEQFLQWLGIKPC